MPGYSLFASAAATSDANAPFEVEFVKLGEEDADGYYSHCAVRGAKPVLSFSKQLFYDMEAFNRTAQLLKAIHDAFPPDDCQRLFDFQVYVKDGKILAPWTDILKLPPVELTQPDALICVIERKAVSFKRNEEDESFEINGWPYAPAYRLIG